MRTVYLDYNATTPLDTFVREAMLPFLGKTWGNPSSIHHIGRRARALLDDARDKLCNLLSCKPSEIVFTSGGTESVNLAIFGTIRMLRHKGRHIVTSPIEHHAVLHPIQWLQKQEDCEVTVLPVDSAGRVDPADVAKAIRKDTVLVSIMAANNEIGTLQRTEAIGEVCRQHNVIFHSDAVQWFGKEPVASVQSFGADLISLCAHKFHGPKGVGALYIRSPLQLEPILLGGGHENEKRAGTENLSGIVGLVEAYDKCAKEPVFKTDNILLLTKDLRRFVATLAGVQVVSPPEQCLPNTVSFVVDGVDSIAILAGLDLEGICASSGSACSAGSLEPSHVVTALGYTRELAGSLIRFSLGRENTQADIDHVKSVLPAVLSRAQTGQQPQN